MLMMFKWVLLVTLTSLPPFVAQAQTKPAQARVVDLPRGLLTRVASPDRKWTLIFECPNDCAQRKLWIEQSRTHSRRAVREFERSLSISWAPDSRSFFINDGWGSNGSDCYVYNPATLKVTDLADVIVSVDPTAQPYLKAGHTYLRAKRWVNSHELLVSLFGHFDEPPARSLGLRHPGAFMLRYHVHLNGEVQKISESSEEQE
jgi:hypothetical protein